LYFSSSRKRLNDPVDLIARWIYERMEFGFFHHPKIGGYPQPATASPFSNKQRSTIPLNTAGGLRIHYPRRQFR